MKISTAGSFISLLLLVILLISLPQSAISLSEREFESNNLHLQSIGPALQLFQISDDDIIILSKTNTISRLTSSLSIIWKQNLPPTEQAQVAFVSNLNIFTISTQEPQNYDKSTSIVTIRQFSFSGELTRQTQLQVKSPGETRDLSPRFALLQSGSDTPYPPMYLQIDWIDSNNTPPVPSLRRNVDQVAWLQNTSCFYQDDLFPEYHQDLSDELYFNSNRTSTTLTNTTQIFHVFSTSTTTHSLSTQDSIPLSSQAVSELFSYHLLQHVANVHHHASFFSIMSIASSSNKDISTTNSFDLIGFTPNIAVNLTSLVTSIRSDQNIHPDLLHLDQSVFLSSMWLFSSSPSSTMLSSFAILYYRDISGQLHRFDVTLGDHDQSTISSASSRSFTTSARSSSSSLFIPPISTTFPPCFDVSQQHHFHAVVSPFSLPSPRIHEKSSQISTNVTSLPHFVPLFSIHRVDHRARHIAFIPMYQYINYISRPQFLAKPIAVHQDTLTSTLLSQIQQKDAISSFSDLLSLPLSSVVHEVTTRLHRKCHLALRSIMSIFHHLPFLSSDNHHSSPSLFSETSHLLIISPLIEPDSSINQLYKLSNIRTARASASKFILSVLDVVSNDQFSIISQVVLNIPKSQSISSPIDWEILPNGSDSLPNFVIIAKQQHQHSDQLEQSHVSHSTYIFGIRFDSLYHQFLPTTVKNNHHMNHIFDITSLVTSLARSSEFQQDTHTNDINNEAPHLVQQTFTQHDLFEQFHISNSIPQLLSVHPFITLSNCQLLKHGRTNIFFSPLSESLPFSSLLLTCARHFEHDNSSNNRAATPSTSYTEIFSVTFLLQGLVSQLVSTHNLSLIPDAITTTPSCQPSISLESVTTRSQFAGITPRLQNSVFLGIDTRYVSPLSIPSPLHNLLGVFLFSNLSQLVHIEAPSSSLHFSSDQSSIHTTPHLFATKQTIPYQSSIETPFPVSPRLFAASISQYIAQTFEPHTMGYQSHLSIESAQTPNRTALKSPIASALPWQPTADLPLLPPVSSPNHQPPPPIQRLSPAGIDGATFQTLVKHYTPQIIAFSKNSAASTPFPLTHLSGDEIDREQLLALLHFDFAQEYTAITSSSLVNDSLLEQRITTYNNHVRIFLMVFLSIDQIHIVPFTAQQSVISLRFPTNQTHTPNINSSQELWRRSPFLDLVGFHTHHQSSQIDNLTSPPVRPSLLFSTPLSALFPFLDWSTLDMSSIATYYLDNTFYIYIQSVSTTPLTHISPSQSFFLSISFFRLSRLGTILPIPRVVSSSTSLSSCSLSPSSQFLSPENHLVSPHFLCLAAHQLVAIPIGHLAPSHPSVLPTALATENLRLHELFPSTLHSVPPTARVSSPTALSPSPPTHPILAHHPTSHLFFRLRELIFPPSTRLSYPRAARFAEQFISNPSSQLYKFVLYHIFAFDDIFAQPLPVPVPAEMILSGNTSLLDIPTLQPSISSSSPLVSASEILVSPTNFLSTAVAHVITTGGDLLSIRFIHHTTFDRLPLDFYHFSLLLTIFGVLGLVLYLRHRFIWHRLAIPWK